MSATVAAALKKIAVAILTDKKLRKTVLGVILGVILMIAMPFAAIIGMFSGEIKIDYDRLQTLVVENLSPEEKARLQKVEDLMYELKDTMSEKGYDERQFLAAQVLFVTALSDDAEDANFVDKLVGCFAEEQTDTELIANVNTAFGTNIRVDEFTKLMSMVHRKIVSVALSQVGNEGGEPYWSWYGFDKRVEWCACFVSWCANECGYLDTGVLPKFSGCEDGVNWFIERAQWLEGNEIPSAGMIIFFDWDNKGSSGPQDGKADHVGIVEKVENGIVYTIEGNSGDACKQNQYNVGHYEILGYGYYETDTMTERR